MRFKPCFLAQVFVIMWAAACTPERDIVDSSSPAFRRERAQRPNVLRSSGDGSVAHISATVAAKLGKREYVCAEHGGPLANGATVIGRTYTIGSGTGATVIKVTTKDGSPIQRTVQYTDRLGDRRILIENGDSPLAGPDSVALALFDAASTAPCTASGS